MDCIHQKYFRQLKSTNAICAVIKKNHERKLYCADDAGRLGSLQQWKWFKLVIAVAKRRWLEATFVDERSMTAITQWWPLSFSDECDNKFTSIKRSWGSTQMTSCNNGSVLWSSNPVTRSLNANYSHFASNEQRLLSINLIDYLMLFLWTICYTTYLLFRSWYISLYQHFMFCWKKFT